MRLEEGDLLFTDVRDLVGVLLFVGVSDLVGVGLRDFVDVELRDFVDVPLLLNKNDFVFEGVNIRLDEYDGNKLVDIDGLGEPDCDTLGVPVVDGLDEKLNNSIELTVYNRLHAKSLKRFI